MRVASYSTAARQLCQMGFPVSEHCSFVSGCVLEICRTEHLSDVAHAKTVDNGEQVSGEDCAIPMAPWPAGAIAAIALPSSSAFYHRPFTETFQIQREGGGGGWKKQDGAREETRSASTAPSARLLASTLKKCC